MIDLENSRILLTGAAGGIGRELAIKLAARGAHLVLVGRSAERLLGLQGEIKKASGQSEIILGDISSLEGCAEIIRKAELPKKALDVLINNAGINDFRPFSESSPRQTERLIATNLLAPMHLARGCLTQFRSQGWGRIVNIGSTFGSIGFPGFSSYSASKFALRGFSESLRRELSGTGIGVTYIAPRAVRTEMNAGAIGDFAHATGMKMDAPGWVAGKIVAAIEREREEVFLGFPEKLIARLNALLPRLFDKALGKQTSAVMEVASRNRAASPKNHVA